MKTVRGTEKANVGTGKRSAGDWTTVVRVLQ